MPGKDMHLWRRLCWGLLIAAPVGLLFYGMASMAVDMPYQDAWEHVTFLQKAAAGTMTPGDIFAQHNESRLPFLRLLVWLETRLTGWDTRGEQLLIALLALASFGLLAAQARRLARIRELPWPPWIYLALAALFFSLIQCECWSFGFTLTGSLSLAAALLGFLWLAQPSFAWRRLLGAILAGVVALYAYSNGLLFFGAALLPLWVSLQRPARRAAALAWLVWLGAWGIWAALFFKGYHQATQMPAASFYLMHGVDVVYFLLVLLGGGIVHLPYVPYWVAGIWGLMGLLLFLGAALLLWLRLPQHRAVLSFWIALGAYALGTASMVTLGRIHHGLAQTLASRYAVISSLFWICTLVLVASAWPLLRQLLTRKLNRGWASALTVGLQFMLGAGAILFVISSVTYYKAWQGLHKKLVTIQAELLCDVPDFSVLGLSYLNAARLPERINFLERQRLSVFRDKKSLAEYQIIPAPAGAIARVWSNAPPAPGWGIQTIFLEGSAYDTQSRRAARRVLIVNEDDLIVATASVRPASNPGQATWTAAIPAAKFPQAEARLRAYAILSRADQIAFLGEKTVRFSPTQLPTAARPTLLAAHPRLCVGCVEAYGLVQDQFYALGWAGCQKVNGVWVFLTDHSATQIIGYARAQDIRWDLVRLPAYPQIRGYGWQMAIHQTRLGHGEQNLKLWVFCPEQNQAYLLADEIKISTAAPDP